MNNNKKWTIGIDLGGTKINIAHVSPCGEIIEKINLQTNVKGGPAAILSQITDAIEKLMQGQKEPPAAIGIGVPGQVELETGVIRFAPNLYWHTVAIKQPLEQTFGVPVSITNDVRAAAWGEWLYGAGKGCRDIVCLFLGTGIGGAIVSNGDVVNGATNSAGEFGHMTIDMNGPSCTCGNWGCLEAFASGWAIARQTEKMIIADPNEGAYLQQLADQNEGKMTAKIVVTAYRKEDPLAIKVMNNVVQAVVAGVISIVNGFNPQKLIMGGGLVDGFPELIAFVNQGIRERALAIACERLEIVHSHLKGDAGVIGAAAYAQRSNPN